MGCNSEGRDSTVKTIKATSVIHTHVGVGCVSVLLLFSLSLLVFTVPLLVLSDAATVRFFTPSPETALPCLRCTAIFSRLLAFTQRCNCVSRDLLVRPLRPVSIRHLTILWGKIFLTAARLSISMFLLSGVYGYLLELLMMDGRVMDDLM